tara:strand:+ start:288 stop:497 length:210 start_codon:yes stop_codon:yes gene_type:complete
MVVKELIHLLKLVQMEVQEAVAPRVVEQVAQEMFLPCLPTKEILVEMLMSLQPLIIRALAVAVVILVLG